MALKNIVGVLLISLLISACASRGPAPVEERSSGWRSRASLSRLPPATEHQVQRGDTLYGIAFRYGLDWRSLAAWNTIPAPYVIHPGDTLRLTEPPRWARSRNPQNQETVRPLNPRPAPPSSSKPVTVKPQPTPPASKPPVKKPVVAEKPPPKVVAEAKPPPAKPKPKPATTDNRGVNWRWPSPGRLIRGFQPQNAGRQGVDIAGKAGDPVVAAAAGTVVYSGTGLIGYGELIIIKHNDRLLSAYGHNRRRLVQEGEQVKAGQPISEMGQNASGETLLHFEIRDEGKPQNPLDYLPRR
ncbi:MAG: hypothetical protein Tsb002_03210 [Wenzhouxiangellaceae bacterium]